MTLRIAIVTAFPPSRLSLNEYGFHLAREIAARDDVSEVIVLADRLDSTQSELDLGPKLRVERVWSFNSGRSLPSILSALRRTNPDGVLYNLQTATFGDREAPAALGLLTPMVGGLLGWNSGVLAHNIIAGVDLERTLLKGQPLRQAVVRAAGAVITRALCSASYVTVPLAGYRDALLAACPRADVSLVPHGSFDAPALPPAPLASRPMRIVTMGKFGTYKRIDTLLAAFDILRDEPGLEDMTLQIGGSDHPNAPGYMAAHAEARREDPRVSFLGYVPEDAVADFLGGARACIFDYEATTGSSGVLHQTASFGAVPVFPRIGDFVDLCRDEGLSGLHYQPGDAVGMAQAIREALTADSAVQDLADSNRKAAGAVPLAAVAEFHVRRLARGARPPIGPGDRERAVHA